jgi:predicted ABC-type ATPase
MQKKYIYIIAGPNGAGKTTFAKSFIPDTVNITQYVNADLIAYGLSPFTPEREAVQAGKLMLRQIDKLVQQGESFCLETTLAGRAYARKIREWQKAGYCVKLIFLSLPDVETAIARVAARVAQGGHAIPEDVIRRRFEAGLENFGALYKDIVDSWILFDNANTQPFIWNLEKIMDNKPQTTKPSPELQEFIELTTRALIKSGQEARKLAELTGTPLVVRDINKDQSPSRVQPQ